MAINIWKVCVGSTLTSYNVREQSAGSCPEPPAFAGWDYQSVDWEVESLSGAVGANLWVDLKIIYYDQDYLVLHNVVKSAVGAPSGPYNYIDSAIIDLGETIEEFPVNCRFTTAINIDGYGDGTITYRELSSVVLLTQDWEPTCDTPPPACELDITGYTATSPSQRGIDDGSIDVSVSGMTGTTIGWYIDGVIDTGQTEYNCSFTGLTAGDYWIKATEGPCLDQVEITVPQGDFRTGDFTVTSPSTTGAIVAVENPVMINISTDINSIQPLYSINTFSIDDTISDVVIQFELTFPYVYSAVFYSKGFPDRNNYFLESVLTDEVGTPTGSNSTTEIATSLAEAFEADSIISRLYYIFNDGTDVTLTSKEYNGQYDLSTSNVTITGSNLTMVNEQEGVAEFDGGLESNYSVYTEVFVDDDIQYGETQVDEGHKRVTELELPFQRNNNHQFNLSPVLKNFVSSPKFNFSFTGATYMIDMICSYYVKYGEKYPLIPNSNTKKKRNKGTGGFNWAINSALDFETSNRMNSYFPSTGTTLFLNTATNTKFSHRDAKEFLNIVVEKDYQYPTAVFADILMYDGTLHLGEKLYDLSATGGDNQGGIAALAVDYEFPGISQYEVAGAKIRRVDITMKYTDDGGSTYYPYSETKTINYEIDEQPDNFNIAFLNKFGTYETYTFVGEVIDESDVTRSSYQKPYPINPNGSASGGFEHNSTLDTTYTKVYTLNTGIIDEDTWFFLQGMLNSNRIYHYDETYQTYMNIIGQTSTKSTNTNEYSLQVVVMETINENNVNQ